MRKVQLHIFDFDGTIFFSPAPPSHMKQHHDHHHHNYQHEQSQHDNSRYDSKLYGQLYSPLSSGGLGWFQSLSSLSPPHVPESPAIDKWFEPNVLKRIGLLTSLVHKVHANENNKAEKLALNKLEKEEISTIATVKESTTHAKHVIDVDASSSSSSSSSSLEPLQENVKTESLSSVPHSEPTSEEDIKLFILTGRDEKYRTRIEHLLAHAGILPSITKVFLKPFETAGTVRYKLDTFMHLIEQYKPSHVYYYEDRLEQGGKLLLGVRAIQERLCSLAREEHHKEKELEQQSHQESVHHSSEASVMCELKEMHDSCAQTTKSKESKVKHDNTKKVEDKDNIEQLPMTEKQEVHKDELDWENELQEHEDGGAGKTSEASVQDAVHEYNTECRHDRILATLEEGESTFKRKCMELCFEYDPTNMQRAERQVHQ